MTTSSRFLVRTKCPISEREKEVLQMISFEYSTKEIAQKLFISYETVNSHRKNLLRKLKTSNTAGMIRKGFELGILKFSYSKPSYLRIE